MSESTYVKALLLNGRGINSWDKQILLLSDIQHFNVDICFITETKLHSLDPLLPELKKWARLIGPPSLTDRGSGLLILVNPSLNCELEPIITSPCHLLFRITFPGQLSSTFQLVYGPHSNKTKFWESLPMDMDVDAILGDFNFIDDPIDAHPQRKIQHWLAPWKELGLIYHHQSGAPHTHFHTGGSARLDHLYARPHLISNQLPVHTLHFKPTITDHLGLCFGIQLQMEPRDPKIWHNDPASYFLPEVRQTIGDFIDHTIKESGKEPLVQLR